MFILDNVTCGNITIDEIVPDTVSTIVTILKIAIPIILIVLGLLDLGKAVMANEEKEMKEAQGRFIKRCIYAVLVFFVVAIVQFVFKALAPDGESIWSCIDGILNGTTE